MKILQCLTLSLFIILCRAPLIAKADTVSEIFTLPNGRVAEAYQADIEAVLRDKYGLKIETGMRNSIIQWALQEGDLPPGITLSTDGRLGGIPKAQREEPYQFRVRVIDLSIKDSGPLVITLSLTVAAPNLRLTRISGPALVPVNTSMQSGNDVRVQNVPATEHSYQGGATSSPLPVPTDAPEAGAPLPPALPPQRRGGGNGILSKVINILGLGQGSRRQQSGSGATGCAAGSNARRVVSDEVHTPLEGDTSTQNTCVEFVNLNTLKYRIEFGTKTTRTEGPDLSSLPFLPKLTPTSASAVTQASTPTPTSKTPGVVARAARESGIDAKAAVEDELRWLDQRFNAVVRDLNRVESDLRMKVEDRINLIVTDVENAHKRSVRLANSADLYLQSNNTAALLTEVGTTKGLVDTALTRDWPAAQITAVLTGLNGLSLDLENVRFDDNGKQDVSQEAWAEWLSSNQDRYTRVRDRIAELKTKVDTINNGATAFNDAKNVLAGWQLIINNVHNQQAAAFEQEAFVSCHTDEAEGKSSKLTISKSDRTVANASAVTREVLTVNCYSRVAVTGGFNFSTLDEREFSVVQSAGAEPGSTVKKFGFTNRSSFRPNPLMLLNVRFTENPVYNWHASFGAVVDLKGQTGTDVEPVAGVSLSIRRIIFFTPFAVHFGRVNRLAGGFKEGDLVPESIATPPLEKAWKVGYTTGVTFRIAPQ